MLGTYYLLIGLFALSASLLWAVNTLFLLDAGLSLLGVFLVNAVFSASAALWEIPTGLVADALGRRKAVLLSSGFMLAGTLLYAAGGFLHAGVWTFALASAVLALGFAFFAGALDAWAVDALRETGNPHSLDFVFAQAAIFSGAGMLVGTALGGLLGSLHLSLPYFLRAVLLAGSSLIVLRRMHDLGYSPTSTRLGDFRAEVRSVVRASLFFGWEERQMRWLIAASAAQTAVTVWGYHAWQPYLLGMLDNAAPWAAGLIGASIIVAMMTGNALVVRVAKYCRKRTTFLLFTAVVFSLAFIGMGVAGSFPSALLYYLLCMGALGVMAPVRQAYIHSVTPSQYRATVASFDAMLGSGASAAGLAGLGAITRIRPLDFGYIAGGFVSLAAVPALLILRRMDAGGDSFDRGAGKISPGAAVGHPILP